MKIRKKSIQINFRTSPEFKRRLDAAASREGSSTTQFIEDVLWKVIKEKENNDLCTS